MRILAVLAFSILYLSTSVEATVEITEARLAGESDAKNLDKWKFKRFAVSFCGSATPILLLSALAAGDAAWDISYIGLTQRAMNCATTNHTETFEKHTYFQRQLVLQLMSLTR